MIKKILWGLLVFVVLDVAIILLLPHLVPTEMIAAKIREQLKQKTGRDLAFSDATFVFFPNLGIEIKNVTLSNAPWAKEKNMLTLGEADVALALKPLLQRQVEIKRFILNAPVINLEVSPDGMQNWNFSHSQAPAAEEGAGDAAEGFGIKFSELKISNGKLSFTDRQKGSTVSVDDIDMTATLPDLHSALHLESALTHQNKRIDLVLDLAQPMEVMRGGASAGHVTLKAGGIAIKGAVQASKTEISFKEAELALNDVRARGSLKVNFVKKPAMIARLSMGKLDLDRLSASAADNKTAPGEKGDAAPLDLSGLKAVDADLVLNTEGFALKGIDAGRSILTVFLKDGSLNVQSTAASLLEGKFIFSLKLNAASAVPTMNLNVDMTGVQAKPLLEAFADFKKLSGTADARVSVTSSGTSRKTMTANLNGESVVVFKNGSLEGIDLVNIAKLIQKRLTDVGVGEGKTDFVELGGTFTIRQGIVSNKDLKMRGPLLQATGQGTVDLPQQYIQYRVIPVLTASSATEGASGLAIPVDIKGPFNAIKVRPDFASVVVDVINNPAAAKKTLKDLKTLTKDPAEALQNLLGGGGLFGAPAETPPAPPPAPEPIPQPSH